MKRQMSWALLAGGIALAASTATAAPAAAATSGSETYHGIIVTSGVSGTRTVISSVLVMKGVFSGVGRIVELPNLPGDPDNVSRDDLVFPEGTMHLLTTGTGFSFSLNPHSCAFKATLQSSAEVTGGTGQFAAAHGSFPTNTGVAVGVGARDPDGSCSMTLPALHEVDRLTTGGGTLSF